MQEWFNLTRDNHFHFTEVPTCS